MNTVRSIAAALLLYLLGPLAQAQSQPQAIPPNILSNINKPMVMMSVSKDTTMFSRAYTDYDDLDGDGVIDRTFMPNYKYYGYFDPTKCYTFSTTNGRFEPKRIATVTSGSYYCTAGAAEWSGNFLNWATMSRIDVLRKVLYGGMRVSDTTTDTTLELSFVPRNSQAIAKYYNGADVDRLTPFNSANALAKGITLCRRPTYASGLSQNNSIYDSPRLFTPVIRVAVGNLTLWNMTEITSCNWSDLSGEPSYTWQAPTIAYLNNNYLTPAGTYAKDVPAHAHLSSSPSRTQPDLLSGTVQQPSGYTARVQACVATLLGEERCKNYGSATSPAYKPIGLLHEFGESSKSGSTAALAEFGLMLGSYDYNLSGGVLRKNMGQFNDEIDPTSGIFVDPPSGTGGIVRSLNSITLYGVENSSGMYSDNCVSTPPGDTFAPTIVDGKCPSWGNPLAALMLESLRYYAGKSGSFSSGTKDAEVGLPVVSTRSDPLKANTAIGSSTRTSLYGQPICRPLTMLTMTSGSNSFDKNVNDLSAFGGSSTGAASLTKTIGDKEGITGTTRLIGDAGAASPDRLCTGKTITGLGAANGVCSDGPDMQGSYRGAGLAYYAHTNEIRQDLASNRPTDLPGDALKVRQYGVSMSGGAVTVTIPVTSTSNVYLTPASLNASGRPMLIVDFKVIDRSSDGKSGTALVLWQSIMGEDQDQDELQSLRWSLVGTTLKVFTQAVEGNTGDASPMATGYTLIGTDKDGLHLHSALNDYVTTETGLDTSLTKYQGPNEGTPGTGCVVDTTTIPTTTRRSLCVVYNGTYYRGETSKTYSATGTTTAQLQEPLWYIAKYGGFKYDGTTYTDLWPTSTNTATWDTERADGKACGGATGRPCSDGVPDNYFAARNPTVLESSLREVLQSVVNGSNTAPATTSTQLSSASMKYVASFASSDGHGELSGYSIKPATGDFDMVSAPTWKAHTALTQTLPANRQIITNEGTTGKAFQWSSLSAAQQAVLDSGTVAGNGSAMLNWLRGDTTTNSLFRTRNSGSILGPIVNSNATMQVPPNAGYFGDPFDGYATFANTYKSRKSVLWVGAGDGMLHAFDADPAGNGTPLLSYVPQAIFSLLPNWASPNKPTVQALVDGSPFTNDVKIGSAWSTYLFSSLGRGAKAMFALDVTDPTALSEVNAASIFRWQFSEADDSSGDLGYIVSEPTRSRFSNQSGQVARMNNGKFAALFGNGISSTNGSAALYILFADGPDATTGVWGTANYKKIVADVGPNNGLSQPVWVDLNEDGIADVIYAGDLKGNLWKFDVSSSSAGAWAVAYGGRALFTAVDSNNNALPITGAPETRPHPMGGEMVDFATGKAYAAADFPNTTGRVDTLFGIWDKPSLAAAPATVPRGLANLAARSLTSEGSGQRSVQGSVIDWTTKFGWYLPYPTTSEMTVSNMATISGELAAISVLPPAAVSAGGITPCYFTPLVWLNIVNPITGLVGDDGNSLLGSSGVQPLASKAITDQKITFVKDSYGVGTAGGVAACSKGVRDCNAGVVNKGASLSLVGSQTSRRIFWREIPGLRP